MHREKIQKLLREVVERSSTIEQRYADILLDAEVEGALSLLKMEAQRQLGKSGAISPAALKLLREQATLIQQRVEGFTVTSSRRNDDRSRRLSAFQHDVSLTLNRVWAVAIGANQLTEADLVDIVPGQKVAAYYFDFAGSRVEVVDRALEKEGDGPIAASALDLAIEHGELTLAEIKRTNASPRLRAAFDLLQRKLESHTNVVQIGMSNKTCSRLLTAEAEEMSSSVFELLRSHIEAVYGALAQFKDWREYVEQVTATNLERSEVDELVAGTIVLAKQLEEVDAVAESVPTALQYVADWVKEEEKRDPRDVLSLGRTLENLWSVITKVALSVAQETVTEGKRVAAKAIVIALLAATTVPMVVALSKIPGAEWVETTIAYFKSTGAQTAVPPAVAPQ